MDILAHMEITGPVRMAGVAPTADRAWWITGDEKLQACNVGAVCWRKGQFGPSFALDTEPLPRSVRFAAGSGRLLVLQRGELLVADLRAADSPPKAIPLDEDQAVDVASTDGRILHLARVMDWPPLRSLDVQTGQSIDRVPTRTDVSMHKPMVAVSPDGRHLAFGHVLDGIEVFDVAAGTSRLWPREADAWPDTRVAGSDLLARLEFSADGRLLMAVSNPPFEGAPILRMGETGGQGVVDRSLARHQVHIALDAGGALAAVASPESPRRIQVMDLTADVVRGSADAADRILAAGLALDTGLLAIVHIYGLSLYGTPSS